MLKFKTLWVALLALLLASCVTVTESRLTKKKSPEQAVENYTQLGLGYIQNGHFDRARNRLQRALAINEHYAPANDAMGLLWQLEGEYDLAEEYFKKAIKQDRSFTQARHHLGRLYVQLQRYDEALKELKLATDNRYYEDRAGAFNDTALAYYRQNQPEQAIHAYRQTMRLAPYNAEGLVNISTLLFEAQNYQESLRYFDRFDRMVADERVDHTAHSLWLGIKLTTIFQSTERAIALASDLKRNFPESEEFRLYEESLSGVR